MEYKDYLNLANEYKEQVEQIDLLLEKYKKKKYFPTAKERQTYESKVQNLLEMRRECIETSHILENKAKEIKNKEIRKLYFKPTE